MGTRECVKRRWVYVDRGREGGNGNSFGRSLARVSFFISFLMFIHNEENVKRESAVMSLIQVIE